MAMPSDESAAAAACTCTEDCAAADGGHYGNCPRFELVIPLVLRRCDCGCEP